MTDLGDNAIAWIEKLQTTSVPSGLVYQVASVMSADSCLWFDLDIELSPAGETASGTLIAFDGRLIATATFKDMHHLDSSASKVTVHVRPTTDIASLTLAPTSSEVSKAQRRGAGQVTVGFDNGDTLDLPLTGRNLVDLPALVEALKKAAGWSR